MKIFYVAAIVAVIALLAGCGGGGTASVGGGSSSSSASAPSLTVTLSATSGSTTAGESATATSATVTATEVASGTITTPIVADLSYDKTVFASVTATPGTAANTYTVTATTLPNLAAGSYASPITFRLCQEAECTHVYAGSNVTYTYNLTVNLAEWTTYQRTASHQGYLPVTLDISKFNKIWSWSNPAGGYLNPVVAGNGSVFASEWPGKVYSFNELTGAQNWVYDLTGGSGSFLPGVPAYDNGTVYAPFMAAVNNSKIRALDASNGTFKTDSIFTSQTPLMNSPVIYQNELYYSQGYTGGQIFKYSLPSGTRLWTSPVVSSSTFGNQSPAVDQNYVYYSTQYSLAIYSRSDGSLVANVADPRPNTTDFYNGYSSPTITPVGHVLFIYDLARGAIEAVDPVKKAIIWRSANDFTPEAQPAVNGNIIYAATVAYSGQYTVQAVSDTDGTTLWSWNLPAPDTTITNNLVVCDNLLFVSSDKAVYAIDLKTHLPVWSYPASGMLSISSNYILYIANGGGTLTAIKLK